MCCLPLYIDCSHKLIYELNEISTCHPHITYKAKTPNMIIIYYLDMSKQPDSHCVLCLYVFLCYSLYLASVSFSGPLMFLRVLYLSATLHETLVSD